uniref:Uncharacterized protein n=1 Tax=Nelumbo nucifera TaxID=4432 RepID=A0A822YT75_NELNU|nr:TPA_asm: hypothetical protein HUJ06_005401 [Nelumbo nucifera]
MYGKSLQQEGADGHLPSSRAGTLKFQSDGGLNISPFMSCHDDFQDPSVHPRRGLAATQDGMLTLLDCFIKAKSLKPLQNVSLMIPHNLIRSQFSPQTHSFLSSPQHARQPDVLQNLKDGLLA